MTRELVLHQLAEAASLMLVGMLVVFSFLSILIVAVKLLSWLCNKFVEPVAVNEIASSVNTVSCHSTGIPKHHVAVITAAFVQHTKK